MPQSQLMINSGVLEILFPPNVWILSNSVVLILLMRVVFQSILTCNCPSIDFPP